MVEHAKGASNPTPVSHEIPTEAPRTLDSANSLDNLQIPRG